MTITGPQTPTAGRLVSLGVGVDYHEAWELQRHLLQRRADGAIPDTLLLLEHAPVYTAGRRTLPEHVRGELNAPLVETDRGGQLTYHGPGQLVGYPIVSLGERRMGPKAYVRALEASIVQALARFDVAAHTEDDLTGVWTERGKIAAIGVRISRGVTMHGFALNVTTNLKAYEPIIACGIRDRPITSMRAIMGSPPEVREVGDAVASALGGVLGTDWNRASL
jgi:lipoyl(octanoyl) transferase